MGVLIKHIIEQYKEVQVGQIWIGTNFEKTLNEIDASSAFTRPIENMISIAENISHLTLWRKETILKINTGKGSKTDECEENWPSIEKLKFQGWDSILSDYFDSMTEIISLLEGKEDDFLSKLYYDTDFKDHYPYSFVLKGMLHHDIYHLGQIRVVAKFLALS